MPVYLDCNATTPMEPAVRKVLLRFIDDDYGNAGSRTHSHGARAKQAVEHSRDQVAAVVDCKRDEVTFTSGATESNNLALLGLASFGEKNDRRHILTTAIEHKAVLEPLTFLQARGFDVEFLAVTSEGWVDPDLVARSLRPDTLLVSVMHANNETGVVQLIPEIAERLASHDAFFHVDAAQGFGKELDILRNPRLDLISISGHKVYAPKGVGALVARRRRFNRPPIEPLMLGGGQERGLRPGTLPVPLVAALGAAAELAYADAGKRKSACVEMRRRALAAFEPLQPLFNGDQERCQAHVLNLSIPGVDSEAVMVAVKDLVSISNGSACTSSEYTPSHVLKAMGLPPERIAGALRLSWCHLTGEVDWSALASRLQSLSA